MDDKDKRLEQSYREGEAQRFLRRREILMADPALEAGVPDRDEREAMLRRKWDSLVDAEIEEIKSRPGKFSDNLLAELYIRAAEVTVANDNQPDVPPEPWRSKLPPLPEGTPRAPERER